MRDSEPHDMVRLLPFVLLSTVFATTVSAGCNNYEDGSLPGVTAPKYRICYDDVCDLTTLSYECANVTGSQQGFANGWALAYTLTDTGEIKLKVTWQGREIDESKHHRLAIEEVAN